MRVLFAPFPELGHLTPILPVAERLRAGGHAIAFLSPRDLGPALAAAGLDAPSLGDIGAPPTVPSDLPIENERFLMRFYASVALRGFAEPALRAAAEAIAAFRPDVVCADPAAYAPIIAATRAGVPWAGVSPLVLMGAPREFSCVMTRAIATVADELVARFAGAGVDARLVHEELVSPWLATLFADEAFLPRALSGNDFAWFVGPAAGRPPASDRGFPWDALDARRPLVYVSPGGGESLSFPDEVFLRIGEALGPAERAQAVFVLHGRIDGPLAARLPSHAVKVRRAPQLALLARARAVVTHGGINTVNECLRAGCPMLVLPIGHEQPLQAELVERAGVGLRLPLRASSTELAEALRHLEEDPGVRARSAELARVYAAADGSVVVADKLLELARERAPLLPPRAA